MADDSPTARTIVGLEIHVQLKTNTKLFCGCPVRFGAVANSCVCPVCLGHPGALPVMNRKAYELSVLTGMALNCTIARHTKWDRKSYYYPDLPKNYQISQYEMPLAEDGWFDVPDGESTSRVRIKRAHLEEDAGKNIHDEPGCTLVDLNRAGTPLLEIVTEPDIRSAEQAYVFCTELQRLVTHLGVSEGTMQKGQMRFEPNVNLAITDNRREYRTPIAEIKNLNSFRAVRSAIAYETTRQLAAWRDDHDYQLGKVPNENRGWNDDRAITEFQRDKEAAHDYRYFPDPDLVPVEVGADELDAIRRRMPELPIAKQARFVREFGLSTKDAVTIVADRPTAELFAATMAAGAPADVAGKQFVNAWLKLANERGVSVVDLGVDPSRMAMLACITAAGTINKSAVDRIAKAMVDEGGSPGELAKTMGLVQVQDADATKAWIDEAFAANEKAVADALNNPKKTKAAIGFLRGQVMKQSRGKADPNVVAAMIESRLQELSGT